jgi:guanylate kinase
MKARDLDTAEQQKRRTDIASSELEQAKDFDYVVLNRTGQLQEAALEVARIIAAEKKQRGAPE